MSQQQRFIEQVEVFFSRQDSIKSLKKEKLIILRELARIGEILLNIEAKFKASKVGFDNKLVCELTNKEFAGLTSEQQEIKKLTALALKYRKLTKLFNKYHKDLVAIELEIIAMKSTNLLVDNR